MRISAVAPDGVADVLGLPAQLFEEVGIELVGLGRSVGGEVGQVEDEAGAEAIPVRAAA